MIIGWNEFQLNNFSLQKLETEKFSTQFYMKGAKAIFDFI